MPTLFLKYYQDLNDTLSPQELKEEFNRLLDFAGQHRISKLETSETLWELANR